MTGRSLGVGRRPASHTAAQGTAAPVVWRFPTSGVVMWSPIRKASEYTRFLASVPSLGHLIAETVSSLASGHHGRELERSP
jgi:hypothetical protein